MIRRPPRSTRTATLFPYTTLFRSQDDSLGFQIVYTVGLSDVDWPELVCAAPLSPDRKASTNLTISILNAFVRALRSTETKPTAGIMLKTTALNVPIALIDVEESRVPEVFKGARHRSLRLGRSPNAVEGLPLVWHDRADRKSVV